MVMLAKAGVIAGRCPLVGDDLGLRSLFDLVSAPYGRAVPRVEQDGSLTGGIVAVPGWNGAGLTVCPLFVGRMSHCEFPGRAEARIDSLTAMRLSVWDWRCWRESLRVGRLGRLSNQLGIP